MGTAGVAVDSAAPTVPFVGAAAVLEPDHVTVGTAPIPVVPKKKPRCYKLFFT